MRMMKARILILLVFVMAAIIGGKASANEDLSDRISGVLDHIADRGISVITASDGGVLVVIEKPASPPDFPELHVILGKDGVLVPAADLGMLPKMSGLQVLRAPASLDIQQYDEVHIWDPDSGRVVGAAPLK